MEEKDTYKHGFKTPEGYFDSVEARLFSRIEEDVIPESSGFETPEGYFDALEEHIMETISSPDETKIIPLFNRRRLIWIGSVAACALLFLSIFLGKGDVDPVLELADIETYFESSDMDSYDLAYLLEEEEIEDLTNASEYIEVENIEDYLLENLDDSSLLIE